jgi:hypothetical protein
MEAQKLIEAIEAAFPVAPLPEMSLHQAQLGDQSMIREITETEWEAAAVLDAGRSWQRFADEELMACDAALAHLEEQSFVYYLPAFLRFAVCHCTAIWPNPAESLLGAVIFAVTDNTPYSLGRYKRLNASQREAVIAFLEFMARNDSLYERRMAEQSLTRYWKTDEVTKPLIIVP